MKRGDLPLMLVCTLLVWGLIACEKKAETSAGGGQIPDKVHLATLLIASHYDISSLSYTVLDRDTPLADVLENGLVRFSDTFIANSPVGVIACVIVHELYHYNHYSEQGETGANAAGRECAARIL